MQLIAILLITVSVLTFLSGLAVFLGARKGDRVRSAWFFLATIFATIWTDSIALFLIATNNWNGVLNLIVDFTFISAIFIDIALLGYISWYKKYGKGATLTFLVLGLIFAGVFIAKPNLIYTEIIFSSSGNSLVTNLSPFFFTYIAFYFALVPAVMITLLKQIIRAKSKRVRGGDLTLLIGFAFSGTAALIFNLILPLWTWYFIWLGPFAISATILAFYYTILRYRVLELNSRWLKILSYIVLITSAAVLYMIVFYIVFIAMFKGSSPSLEVIILNFIMVLFFLLLMPAMNELTAFVRSLITDQEEEKDR